MKKKILKAVALVVAMVLAISSFCLYAAASTVTYLNVTGTDVNVRSSPGGSSIGKVSYQSFQVLGSANSGGYTWYKVNYGGQEGWIAYSTEWANISTPDFETMVSKFPATYQPALRELHKQYPNWEFYPDNLSITFPEAVALEAQLNRKQTQGNCSWRGMYSGAFDWNTGNYIASNGGWYAASRELVAYYLDPRNFLTAPTVIMFMQQSYNSQSETRADVANVISGTFLANGYGGNQNAYIDDIMEAATQSGVSPIVIAATIIQEQGNGSSELISGANGYYNFFNVSASGATQELVVSNGLAYAQSQGWNSRRASIIGGAKFYGSNYVSEGQDTYYYKDFNVKNPEKVWHQYAQAVHDAESSAKKAAAGFTSNHNMKLRFKIPVYTGMQGSPCEKPQETQWYNNYYINDLKIEKETSAGSGSYFVSNGLAPSFNLYNFDYTLEVYGNMKMSCTLNRYAEISSVTADGSYIYITVKAETWYTNTYRINYYASSPATIVFYKTNANSNNEVIKTLKLGYPNILYGDVDLNGKVDSSDVVLVKKHLLEKTTISGEAFTKGDTNSDGVIDIIDLAWIKMYLSGLI